MSASHWLCGAAFTALVFVSAACAPPAPTAAPTSPAAVQKPTEVPTLSKPAAVQPTTAVVQPTTVPATAPPAKNRLVISLIPPVNEGNEPRHLQQPDMIQLRPMYEYLVGFHPQSGQLVPQLATEWKAENGGTTVRFQLRQGVQFHGGKGEFTSKDVKRVWQELAREDSKFAQSEYWRRVVKDVDTPGHYEVAFHLNQPDANFIHALSEAEAGMEIWSSADLDARGPPSMQGSPLAGTGPYQFAERVQGAYIRFERVPVKHWRVTPDFPELEIRWQREASARLAALQAGDADITTLPEDTIPQARQRGFQLMAGKVPGRRVFFNIACCWTVDWRDPSKGYKYPQSPIMDVKVRKALNKAINRDELNKAFFGGKGELMVLNHFHPTRPGWNPEWEKRFPEEYGYDPEKAKALLAEGGYGSNNPLQTTLYLENPFSGADDVSAAVAAYWREVGVDAKLLPMDPGAVRGNQRDKLFDNHFGLVQSSSALLIGMVFNSHLFSAGVEYHDTDALIDRVYKTVDDAEQAMLWRQIGDLFFDRHVTIPLFWTPVEAVVNPKVVDGWMFAGSAPGNWSHFENIIAAH